MSKVKRQTGFHEVITGYNTALVYRGYNGVITSLTSLNSYLALDWGVLNGC
jgi:hypothetical protein